MDIHEVSRLVGKSRRTVMRMVSDRVLPRPFQFWPMSWDAKEVRAAVKRWKEGEGKADGPEPS